MTADQFIALKYGLPWTTNGPCRVKTCLWGFPIKRDSNQSAQLQRLARKFARSKFTYATFQNANNKGADQSTDAQAGLRLCCSQTQKTGFLASRPIQWC